MNLSGNKRELRKELINRWLRDGLPIHPGLEKGLWEKSKLYAELYAHEERRLARLEARDTQVL